MTQRPHHAAKGPSTYRMNALTVNECAVVTALFILQQTHQVPPELYQIIEEHHLGARVIEMAKKTGDATLISDAIAQWG